MSRQALERDPAPTTARSVRKRFRDLTSHRWVALMVELAGLLFALTTLLFFLLHAAGDPAYVLAGQDASAEQIAAIRAEHGLDRPLIVQYLTYAGHLAQLDLGRSLVNGEPALAVVLDVLPATLLLASLAMGLTLLVSIPLGAWIGFEPERWPRHWIARGVFFLQGVPAFVLALLLVQIFAVRLGWLPAVGYGSPVTWILPVVSLALFLVPKLTRVLAANVAEAAHEDFVRVARAAGAGRRELLYGYALPNALLATTALAGTQLAFLLSGTVIIEFIFAWPGIGWLLVESIQILDFAVIQAVALVIGMLVFAVNALVDALLVRLDPRLRTRRR